MISKNKMMVEKTTREIKRDNLLLGIVFFAGVATLVAFAVDFLMKSGS